MILRDSIEYHQEISRSENSDSRMELKQRKHHIQVASSVCFLARTIHFQRFLVYSTFSFTFKYSHLVFTNVCVVIVKEMVTNEQNIHHGFAP